MKLFEKLKNRKLSDEEKRWNLFVDECTRKEMNDFKGIKKEAAICFWYDNEMNSGGHSAFFDTYPELEEKAVYNALKNIGNKQIADNYKEALKNGNNDDYEKTDDKFYEFDPSLYDCLMRFVLDNKDELYIK